jgi:hypothetical protein
MVSAIFCIFGVFEANSNERDASSNLLRGAAIAMPSLSPLWWAACSGEHVKQLIGHAVPWPGTRPTC